MEIRTLHTTDELEAILPLVDGYRRFYEQPSDEDGARAYLARFLPADGPIGVLLAAGPSDAPIGYACLHWRASSFSLQDDAYLSDLFVAERGRGTGAGRALLDACADAARARGLAGLTWLTAIDNRTAQRLYDRYPAARAAVFEYELPL